MVATLEAFHLTIDPEGIARLVFDLPEKSVNVLSVDTMNQLEEILDGISDNKQIRALVITSAKEANYIAGADVKGFTHAFSDHSIAEKIIRDGHRTFNKLAALPFPSIAVIHGACLGGGMELALACTYRVVSDHPKTKLGLPEVNLGIFPGWGGTQRLPRLTGLIEGLTMVMSGKVIDAKKAFKLKLADAILPWEFLDSKVEEFLSTILSKKGKKSVLSRRKRGGIMNWLLEENPVGRAIVYWQSKKNTLKKTQGHYPAPLAAMDVIRDTYGGSLEKGLEREIQGFVGSFGNAFHCAPNLIRLFFAQDELRKNPGMDLSNVESKDVKKLGVLGAGIMGSGIAWVASDRGLSVRMKDVSWDAIAKGYRSIWDTFKTLMRIKRRWPFQANQGFLRVGGTVDYSGFQKVDLVIEAATENLELKHKILAEVEGVVSPDTIIATNTSSLTVTEMADRMKHPERFVGLHFFNPVSRMPLVEVVPGPKTSPEAVATAVAFCKKLRKTPIVVQDCSGFLVNRIFVMGVIEAIKLLEMGVSITRLDKVLKKFGMPMGACELADEVGNDVNAHVIDHFHEVYGDRFSIPKFSKVMVENNWLGKKTKIGFYIWDGKKKKVNKDFAKLLPEAQEVSDQEIVNHMVMPMINEAARCLEEGIVPDPMYVDMAMIMGTGFPPFRGGVLRYADHIGLSEVVSKLEAMDVEVAESLKNMASEGKTFYE